jgi:hypothetical protein
MNEMAGQNARGSSTSAAEAKEPTHSQKKNGELYRARTTLGENGDGK